MNTSLIQAAPKRLEFWFEFGSNYSYLSVMRIEALAAAFNVEVEWKPFLLGPIFRSFGWESSPFILQKAKGEYTWHDMARLCRKYGLSWNKPSHFPRSAVLPLRVALVGADTEWIGEYSRRMMEKNFAEDQEIDTRDVVFDVLTALDLPAAELLEMAVADANKLALREQTATATRRGIFGAPTFFVGDEMFWGNDRLEDALTYCTRANDALGG